MKNLNFPALPFLAPVSGDKKYISHEPVYRHSHPDAEHTHIQVFCQNKTETDTEDPHGADGHPHAVAHVIGRPQGVRQGK